MTKRTYTRRKPVLPAATAFAVRQHRRTHRCLTRVQPGAPIRAVILANIGVGVPVNLVSLGLVELNQHSRAGTTREGAIHCLSTSEGY